MICGTLALLTAETLSANYVLLGEKNYGPDEGKLVLPGGKNLNTWTDEHTPSFIGIEHPDIAILREFHEEKGVALPLDATHCIGNILIDAQTEGESFDAIDWSFSVALYHSFLGKVSVLPEIIPCEELVPRWVEKSRIDTESLQEDVRIWFPYLLNMQRHPSSIYGNALYVRPDRDLQHRLVDYRFNMYDADTNTLTMKTHDMPDLVRPGWTEAPAA